MRGPMLEKYARWSEPSTAATVSAASATPGAPIVNSLYELPAATTKSVPVDAVRSLSACEMGSVPSLGVGSPRLMLTTSARVDAHSMPSMIQESWPKPLSSSTLPTIRCGARRDAPVEPARGGARAGHRRGDVRAVAVAVAAVLAGHEGDDVVHAIDEVGVRAIDARVQHGDRRAGAVGAQRPGLGRAHLRHAVGQVRLARARPARSS